ncbi:hypothetical protein B5E41_01785 [Rhizobium esperanzae]|uniref:N-acetyltransferase domain-containing protein n=1 Tax=Rhizobium esperanzae TaxID=1967781 RepID=A0A246E213_9HYPH|nr:GNAT family N-acetyltransferase [Rhizobium esperanzae]OWO97042.1 hypothetical protein B5E41_01785 [Rhizobium esperanzae]
MTPIQQYIHDIVQEKISAVIDLVDESGTPIGRLLPLTVSHLDDEVILGKLTDWRNANMNFFLTHFTATIERTRSWLANVVFKNPTQLMFLIYSSDQLIGHFGFKDLTEKDVLLDNAMRGERGGHPKLLQAAGRALIDWLFEKTNVKTVYGYVLTTNAAAIMLNRAMGFGLWDKYPLNKSVTNGEARWDIGPKGGNSDDNSYCYRVEVVRSGA